MYMTSVVMNIIEPIAIYRSSSQIVYAHTYAHNACIHANSVISVASPNVNILDIQMLTKVVLTLIKDDKSVSDSSYRGMHMRHIHLPYLG